MLKKNKIIKKTDLLILLTWFKSETLIKNKPFEYEYLIDECHDFSESYVDISTNIESLMLGLFSTYDDLKLISSDQLEEKLSNSFSFLPKSVIEESIKSRELFIRLYESIIMECKFEDSNMRNIQKTMFTILLSKYTQSEEYEKCIELSNKLLEL